MKEKKVKENQGAKGSANLALIRIRVSGKKIFRLDGGITVKAKMKIPRCDSSGHIGVTIGDCRTVICMESIVMCPNVLNFM